MERSRSDEPLFFLAFVSDYVDDGQERHQEADFAVDSAEVRMDGSSEPDGCCRQSADGCQEEHPPQNPRDGIPVAGETCEPVIGPVVEVDVVERQCSQRHT